MEASIQWPEGEPQHPNFTVWSAPDEYGEIRSYLGQDGRMCSELDLVYEGLHGYIDWIDPKVEQEMTQQGVIDLGWQAIADFMRKQHPEIEMVENPNGDPF